LSGPSADGGQATGATGSLLLEVANAMVRLFKEQFGRGPTKARASWAGPDVLTVVLENTFTPAERNGRARARARHARGIPVRLGA
jgi:uncharacterized protein YbcI